MTSSLNALASELYREEVARARAMTAEDKLLEGPRLFHRTWQLMADGVRHAHPELDDTAIRALIEARLSRLDGLDKSCPRTRPS